ncbi:hypothetical protein [Sporosarcina ureilytica]|uniref:Uncharacterized protein n=1 Tax=Sporosarcina ureilytica TaxID=298596 RepID=A0A1D8JBV0_9BACL|nr:hypothetical protein [Sporosarcina ureilytica]AOV06181.1 hypothetical protein BI350_00030 [Sporosarcina ureilytica]
MSMGHKNYPNKADYEPNVDKYTVDTGELPLSDPAESNATEVFRKNEAKTEEGRVQSAFGQNKNRKS